MDAVPAPFARKQIPASNTAGKECQYEIREDRMCEPWEWVRVEGDIGGVYLYCILSFPQSRLTLITAFQNHWYPLCESRSGNDDFRQWPEEAESAQNTVC